MRKRALLISAVVVVVAAGAITATVLSRSNSPIGAPIQVSLADIVRIGTEPFPEGTQPPPFAQAPANAPFYPLDLIRDLIPMPLPAPLEQGDCTSGVTLIIELRDGRVIRYGPCRLPASIEQLRQGLYNEVSILSQPGSAEGVVLSDIESVRLQPIPEGPPTPTFGRGPSSENSLPLDLIEDRIPFPLPPLLDQGGCSFGGDLIIELVDGRTIAYGPCRRPPEIDVLWARMVEVITGGSCLPNCGPGRP